MPDSGQFYISLRYSEHKRLLAYHTVARPGDRAFAIRNIICISGGPPVDS